MSEQPNVLLICTDHWQASALGCAGHPSLMTPTLDQIAACGVRFTQAYSASPSCIPARRSLMTGMTPRANGLNHYREGVDLPDVTTMAQAFRDAGYQAFGVGKLHLSPQRTRAGFDDVLLEEQGRHQLQNIPDGAADDYELFLARQGFGGQEYAGGMCHNDFITRPWHLPEHCHPINWAARELCTFIRRRDATRPQFWYLSFSAPHPPLTPLPDYLEQVQQLPLPPVARGDWAAAYDELPWVLRGLNHPPSLAMMRATPEQVELSRRAYLATLTQIDHQIRVVIGYLREANLLTNTIICFTSDHGHTVGEHGLWCMTPFLESTAKIPLLLMAPENEPRVVPGTTDDRLADFGDIMPTLLDLAGIPIPDHCDQLSLVGEERRTRLYGEHGEGPYGMRMIREGEWKLIYYAAGNRFQLFHTAEDPQDLHDRSDDARYSDVMDRLQKRLADELYGEALHWLQDGQFVGLPEPPEPFTPDRRFRAQRGLRFT